MNVTTREAQRAAMFAANPMVAGFLSTMLQDAQLTEFDESGTQEREERDTGTIYDCPDATFRAAIAECDAFVAAAEAIMVDGLDVTLGAYCRDSFAFIREHIGSDLYLERAGHGAGFCDRDIWAVDDRDLNRCIGEALSGCVAGPSLETYLGDDGALYIVGRESVS